MTKPKNHGSFLGRLIHGTSWAWVAERHQAALPHDLSSTVMNMTATDRLHAKQGRSTARVRFDASPGGLSVYLKRHERFPWFSRLGALVAPGRGHTPASAEWGHLEHARSLGVEVPEVVAVGEEIGPWTRLRSFLMVAELTGREALNEALPGLKRTMSPAAFAALKRKVVREMAEIAARLHSAHAFHKDFYLCHFFIDPEQYDPDRSRLVLIDLHRLGVHRLTAPRWRWKDLGQLLYSTFGVEGIDDRDRLRFWMHYRESTRLKWPERQRRLVKSKAARYLAHNR